MEKKDDLKAAFKNEARIKALSTAEKLNPNQLAYNNQLVTGISVKPTAAQVLKDADVIYEWLIKDL